MASGATSDSPVMDEPVAGGTVALINGEGASAILLVCEHASHQIPAAFGTLGLPDDLLASHIAWDPGALAVAARLSAAFDAPLVAQRVSRLIYDCNRPPEAPDAIPAVSEIYPVPGNEGLDEAARGLRVERYYRPFRAKLSATIEARIAAGKPPVVVTVHSFTPVFKGEHRAVEIGVLHDSDARLADRLLARTGEAPYDIRRNEPYGPEDGVTHTLVDQAVSRGLVNVMLEIRNDLIADEAGQARVADFLARWIGEAVETVQPSGARNA